VTDCDIELCSRSLNASGVPTISTANCFLSSSSWAAFYFQAVTVGKEDRQIRMLP